MHNSKHHKTAKHRFIVFSLSISHKPFAFCIFKFFFKKISLLQIQSYSENNKRITIVHFIHFTKIHFSSLLILLIFTSNLLHRTQFAGKDIFLTKTQFFVVF